VEKVDEAFLEEVHQTGSGVDWDIMHNWDNAFESGNTSWLNAAVDYCINTAAATR
jgi:hypothetical protein